MEKNFSVLKFLSQVFTIYGVITLLLNVFCVLFGAEARGISTIFALGDSGVGVETSLQFLLAIFMISVVRVIFMTDVLIKKMPLAARIVAMFAGAFAVILAFIFAFGWFPADMPMAWMMFIMCFILCSTVGTLLSVLAEKQENRRLEEALNRYKEEG